MLMAIEQAVARHVEMVHGGFVRRELGRLREPVAVVAAEVAGAGRHIGHNVRDGRGPSERSGPALGIVDCRSIRNARRQQAKRVIVVVEAGVLAGSFAMYMRGCSGRLRWRDTQGKGNIVATVRISKYAV